MPFVTPEQAAAAAESTVRIALLVELQFRSATMRLWDGAGKKTVAGVEWQGVGGFGSVEGLQQLRTTESQKITLKLSGVTADMIALAKASRADVEGRPCYIWTQLFDADWQPVGPRIATYRGLMQRIKLERQGARDLDGGMRACALEVENPFAARARPPNGRYTDADQQSRYPGDTFCSYVPLQQGMTLRWP